MPVYPLVAGISNQQRVAWARFVLKYLSEVPECLPKSYLQDYMGGEAKRWPHYIFRPIGRAKAGPGKDWSSKSFFSLPSQFTARVGGQARGGIAHRPDGKLVKAYRASLPFRLTEDQERALQEVGGQTWKRHVPCAV